jgi:hypothetical protein
LAQACILPVPERCAWITFALCASLLGVWLSSWLTVTCCAQGTVCLLVVLWVAWVDAGALRLACGCRVPCCAREVLAGLLLGACVAVLRVWSCSGASVKECGAEGLYHALCRRVSLSSLLLVAQVPVRG